MNSRTRSRKPASIGSNHSSRNPTAISGFEPRTGNFVLLFVMAWSPPAHNAGIVWVSAPGDYATFNSNHTPDGTVEPNKTLSYTWAAYGLESVVTWTLTPTSTGTHLRMEQSGFRPDQQQYYQGARGGWQRFVAELEQVVARID